MDIIIGVPAEGDPMAAKAGFTIQKEPVNEFIDDWRRFVSIKGGQYFFFPSMTMINYITTL